MISLEAITLGIHASSMICVSPNIFRCVAVLPPPLRFGCYGHVSALHDAPCTW